MRILLTGANGQFGRMFAATAAPRHEVIGFGHAQLKVDEAAAVATAVTRVRPDWIVHAAAMTDVDGCERDPQAAHRVNAEGSGNVARAAAKSGARVAVLSTDYVFDGERGRYNETDAANPVSVYGTSKLEGERLAVAAVPGTLICRTAVVWGPHKKNFVSWVRDGLRNGTPLRIVKDQWVSPTHTLDLSRQVVALVEAGASGIYNTAGAERLSRLEMAQHIARHDGLDASAIEPIAMSDLAWVARRPRDSSLDVRKISAIAKPMPFDATLDLEVVV